MDWSANKNQRCCATCANWSGPRSPKCGGDGVIVPLSGGYKPEAKCYNDPRVGGFANGPKADWCCPRYIKWGALK